MSYRDIFKADPQYTEIVATFKRKKAKLELMASQGLYRKAHLQEVAGKLQKELRENVEAFNRSKMETLQEAKKALQSKNNRVGYAERADEVKELEMRFKLASKQELEDMVQDLETDDLLEVNLLRSELKDRKLEDLDARAQRYVNTNLVGVGGLDEEGKKQLESIDYQIGVFNTMRNEYIVDGEELVALGNVERDLMNTANTTENNKSIVRDVDIASF